MQWRVVMTHLRSLLLLVSAALGVSCSADDPHPQKQSSTEQGRSALIEARELWGVAWGSDATVLRRQDGRIAPVLPAPAAVAVSLPTELGDDALSLVDSGTRMELRFSAKGMRRVQAEIDGGVVVYRGAAPGGGNVFVRSGPEGIEDFVELKRPLAVPELRYALELRGVAGLRLVDSVLEVLDESGTPRLRVQRPHVIDAKKVQHRAKLSLRGCRLDLDPRGPWGRPVVPPGSDQCELAVSFDDTGLSYPLLVDPAWKITQAMTAARAEHSMVRLPNGKVLAAGSNVGSLNATAELFDPTTDTWAVTGTMKSGRSGFSMFL